MKRGAQTTLVAIAILLAGCADDRSAGGADEMGNFVRVALTDSVGNPAAGATLEIRSAGEIAPPDAPSTPAARGTTGADGAATIVLPDTGAWTVVASAAAGAATDTFTLSGERTDAAIALRLGRPGRIRGSLDPTATDRQIASLAGTGRSVAADSSGSFVIDSVPPGPLVLEGSSDGIRLAAVRLELPSGKDTLLGRIPLARTAWSDSAVIVLDAGERGIALERTLAGFPVPIALDSSLDGIERMAANGADLRATDAAGRVLPVALEDWDAATRSGVAWVRLDSLRAGVDSQTVVLCWGNPGAPALRRAVFAGSDGWTGVWHLGASLADGSDRGRAAIDSQTETTAGAVGRARLLRRARKAHLTVEGGTGAEPAPLGEATLEAWVRCDAPDTVLGWDAIATHDDVGLRIQRRATDSVLSFGVTDSLASSGDSLATWGTNGRTSIVDGRWHLVAGMRRGDSLIIFVDGRKEIAEAWAKPWKRTTLPLSIGRNAGARHWDGAIDEVRMATRGFSDEWMRASFEATSPNGRLLRR